MAEKTQTGFSHIKVGGSVDEDDIVIVAGSRSAVDASLRQEPVSVDGSEALDDSAAPQGDPEPIVPEVAEDPSRLDDVNEGQSALVSAPTAEEEEPAKAPSRKKDDYQSTTLEDLESTKMGSTQKIVIVVAVLLLIAAVAWFVMH